MIETGILLESGTNEFEVLIFNVSDKTYGVNVAKVREIISPSKITPCPGQPESMLGMISQRGVPVPLISLHRYLNVPNDCKDPARQCIIVKEFSQAQCAFLADSVEQIVRANWTQIRPLPELDDLSMAKATGVFVLEERLIPMVDFELIYAEHFPRTQGSASDDNSESDVDRSAQSVFIADDSPSIRRNIEYTLVNSGYTNVTAFNNGGACWEQMQLARDAGELPDILITDVEMPLMDGLTLTRKVKEDPKMAKIPVVLFSSLISEDNRNKGEQVGADMQLAKPMISEVVHCADQLIAKAAARAAGAETQTGLHG